MRAEFVRGSRVVKRSVVAGVALAVVLSVSACSSKPAADESRMPAASKDFSGEKYQDVVDDLKRAGFTDVASAPLGDLVVGLLHRPGDVKDVEINGSKDGFDKGATFDKDAKIVVEYHSDPIAASASPSVEGSPDSPSGSEATVLTAANSSDLKALLAVKDPSDPSVAVFASKYLGKTIEFDGNIADIEAHGSTQTLEDVLINAGDYDADSATGPNFQLPGVSRYRLPAGGVVGSNVHVTATLGSYDSETQLYQLGVSPITITTR
jgi:hypothetical protein